MDLKNLGQTNSKDKYDTLSSNHYIETFTVLPDTGTGGGDSIEDYEINWKN